MTIRLPARIGAFACLGVAATMAVLALREEPKPPTAPIPPAVVSASDPLRIKLADCQLQGQAAASDATCLAAWAENRRRFLGGTHTDRNWQAVPANDVGNASSSPEN